jgi:hypothetical protein
VELPRLRPRVHAVAGATALCTSETVEKTALSMFCCVALGVERPTLFSGISPRWTVRRWREKRNCDR